MGLITFLKKIGQFLKKGAFSIWILFIVVLDLCLFLYHALISIGTYPPMALLSVELLTLIPLIIYMILFGGKNDRLRNKDEQADKSRSYAELENRARI